MSNSEIISIKTKFKNKEECRLNCIDTEGNHFFAKTWSSKLFGVFQDDSRFLISSFAKVAFNFEFEGRIIEKKDAVFMEGVIRVKTRSRYITYGSILLFSILGILLMSRFNVVFASMGIMFMIVPWLNLSYLRRTDSLYKLILKKVS